MSAKNGSANMASGEHSTPACVGFAATGAGTVRYAAVGSPSSTATPLIGVHASARSLDDFTEILSHLSGPNRRIAAAVDLPGYGSSPPQDRDLTHDDVGDVLVSLADRLGLDRFALVGSGLGTLPCINAAARHPDRVEALVNIDPYLFKEPLIGLAKQGHFTLHFNKEFEHSASGSHFQELWERRLPFAPPELNTRLLLSHIQFQLNGDISLKKRGVTTLYEMIAPLFDWTLASTIQGKVLNLHGVETLRVLDGFGFHASEQVPETDALFSNATSAMVPGASLWALNLMPAEMARLITEFVDGTACFEAS